MSISKINYKNGINKIINAVFVGLNVALLICLFLPLLVTKDGDTTTTSSFITGLINVLDQSGTMIKEFIDDAKDPNFALLLTALLATIFTIMVVVLLVIGLVNNIKTLLKGNEFANKNLSMAILCLFPTLYIVGQTGINYAITEDSYEGTKWSFALFFLLLLAIIYLGATFLINFECVKKNSKATILTIAYFGCSLVMIISAYILLTSGLNVTFEDSKVYYGVSKLAHFITFDNEKRLGLIVGAWFCSFIVAYLSFGIIGSNPITTEKSKLVKEVGPNAPLFANGPKFVVISLIFMIGYDVCISMIAKDAQEALDSQTSSIIGTISGLINGTAFDNSTFANLSVSHVFIPMIVIFGVFGIGQIVLNQMLKKELY